MVSTEGDVKVRNTEGSKKESVSDLLAKMSDTQRREFDSLCKGAVVPLDVSNREAEQGQGKSQDRAIDQDIDR